ncbi:MAG: ABC transporter permease [Acidobacteriota bacterium]
MPDWKHEIRRRLAGVSLEATRESEIVEELGQHLDDRYKELLAGGATPEESSRAALAELSESQLLAREVRQVERQVAPDPIILGSNRRSKMIADLWQNLRYGTRMWLKRPGFTFLAVLTLALGIGANTAIFSVVQAVLLRPLPFADQERLVVAWKKDAVAYNPLVEMAFAEFKDWQAQSLSFDGMAVMPTIVLGAGYVMTGRGEAVQVESSKVSGGFFGLLGANAALGRVFNESDDVLNGPKVAVLSDQLWRERFNADPNIIGQTITLTQASFSVIGVMPAQFDFPKGAELWVPFQATSRPQLLENRGAEFLQVVGKLKPGVTLPQAEAELNTIIARVAAERPETKAEGQRVVIKPLAEHLFGNARPALWALLAATALLLMIGAANVANLLLAQASARRREFAVRAALGAGRWQIVRQLLCESGVLVVCGGATGVVLAYWLIDLLVWVAPANIPRIETVRLNSAVLLFSLLVTLVTACLAGLVPALTAARVNLNETLCEGSSKLASGGSGKRLRSSLVVAEIAITLVLLIGATLILRSFLNLSRVDLGFDPHNVLTMQLRLTGPKYTQPETRREFYRQLIERLEAEPGVVAASAVLMRPLDGEVGWETHFALAGQSPEEAGKNPVANLGVVTPHYFRTFGIPIKAGREFSAFDTPDAPLVAIINETMARRLVAPGVDPVGQRLQLDPDDPQSPWATIIGIVGDVRHREFEDERYAIYRPNTQTRHGLNHFAVRTTSDAAAFMATVRREIAAIDPTQVATSVATTEQQVATHLARPRFNALLLNWLSGLAVLLAAVGIYGVVAYSVAQRTGELGIRLALGAQTKDILQLIIGENVKLVAAGVVGGLVCAAALTRLLERLLFDVSATDPLTFAVIPLLLSSVALLACWIPARRATKVDPMVALRCE